MVVGEKDNGVFGRKNATLILENGMEFHGKLFGAEKTAAGEVVFNTGMVGYPESLTDPSYAGQILVLTYPLIGNYGVPPKSRTNGILDNFESEKIHVKGLIVADYSNEYSHWNAKQSLSEWLAGDVVGDGIPAITGIDTRKLTKVLRTHGTMLGKIVFGTQNIDFYDPNKFDIVKEVTAQKPAFYNDGGKKRVVLIDCGVKNNIIRSLVNRDIEVVRVPYDYDFLNEISLENSNEMLDETSDKKYLSKRVIDGKEINGIVISNGPGDPVKCVKTIANIKKALEMKIPTFGICLGNQLLALAAGGKTYKLKFGHRSQNQPCLLMGSAGNTKRCFITTQNHGFAVDMKTLDADWEEFFVNANDGTNEGIRHKTKPFMSCQFHPEGHSGPEDTNFLFDEFAKMIK